MAARALSLVRSGTPQYLPPEMWLGTEFDSGCNGGSHVRDEGEGDDLAPADAISQSAPQHGAAADWWMLGVTMYELLHGVRPFERCPAVLVRACRASARRDGLGGSPRSPAAPAMARLPAELRVWARGFSRECNAVLTGLLDCRPAARVDDDNDNENGCAARAHPRLSEHAWFGLERCTLYDPTRDESDEDDDDRGETRDGEDEARLQRAARAYFDAIAARDAARAPPPDAVVPTVASFEAHAAGSAGVPIPELTRRPSSYFEQPLNIEGRVVARKNRPLAAVPTFLYATPLTRCEQAQFHLFDRERHTPASLSALRDGRHGRHRRATPGASASTELVANAAAAAASAAASAPHSSLGESAAAGETPLVVAAQEPQAARAGSAMPRAAVSTIAQVLPSALAVPLCHLSNALKKEENRHAARVWRRFRSREGG